MPNQEKTFGRAIRLAVAFLLFLAPAAGADAPTASGDPGAPVAVAGESWKDKVVAVPVTGAIVGKPFSEMADLLREALEKAERDQARLVVLEIDSPGGEVGVCDALSRRIFELRVPVVSLVVHKAVSGGAMLATAAREIIMTRSARIGDIQPMQASLTGSAPGMDDRTAEKIEVDIRTIMKVFAERHGRPVAVVEAMVSRSSSLYQVSFAGGGREYLTGHELALLEENIGKGRDSRRIAGTRILKPEGKLLELSAAEAVEYGLASETVESRDAFYAARGVEPGDLVRADVVEGEINLRKMLPSLEDFGLPIWVVALLGVFLAVGVIGVVTEYNAPGSGIPAAVGVIGFACFFSTLLMYDRGNPAGIVIFLIGFGLLVVEIMVLPGFGLAGITGVLGILAGLLLAFMPSWNSPYMAAFMWNEVGIFSILLLIGLASAVLGIWFISEHGERIPLLGGLFLTKSQEAGANPNPETADARTDESRRELLLSLAGKPGVAETMLRPSGKVRLDSGELLDVVSEGAFVEAGSRVVIRGVSGGQVVAAPEKA